MTRVPSVKSTEFNNDSIIQFSEFLESYPKLVACKDTHNIEKLITKEGVENNKEEAFHYCLKQKKIVFVEVSNEKSNEDEMLKNTLTFTL